MWDVSDRWDKAIRYGWRSIVARAEVWQNNAFTGTTLQMTGGNINIAESSKVRRSLQLSSADLGLDPVTAESLLSPFGTDLKLFAGGTYVEGDEESVPCGVFRMSRVGRRSYFGPVDIVAEDYSRVVADDRLLKPWNTTGQSVFAEMVALIDDVFGAGVIECFDLSTDGGSTTPAMTFDRERWDGIEDLATAIGAEPVFDQQGRFILRDVPVVGDNAPDWVIDANSDTAVLTDVETGMSDERIYNMVVASSSAATVSVPISGFAYQKTGPLRWRDGFKRPRFFSSPILLTQTACAKAAETLLARSILWERQADPNCVPNPALDCGDVVDLVLPDGTTSRRVISGIQLPLGPGEMSLTTRIDVDPATATSAEEVLS